MLDLYLFLFYYNVMFRLYFNDLIYIEYCEKKFSYYWNGNVGE